MENIRFPSIQDLNLDELSMEACNLILTYPWKEDDLCDCIRKIAKYICVQIGQQLADEHINDEPKYERSTEIEFDSEYYVDSRTKA